MSSLNNLISNGFNIVLARAPNLVFRAQRVSIPGMDAQSVPQPTPFKQLFHTPDSITYTPFSINFILDEKMQTYFEISNWMRGITFPEDFEQYREIENSEMGLKSNLSVFILNSKGNPNFRMDVEDAFPTNLDEIQLSISDSATAIVTMNVTFAYNSFKLEAVK